MCTCSSPTHICLLSNMSASRSSMYDEWISKLRQRRRQRSEERKKNKKLTYMQLVPNLQGLLIHCKPCQQLCILACQAA